MSRAQIIIVLAIASWGLVGGVAWLISRLFV